MNIAFLYRIYPNYGGVEVVTTILANKFVADGHNVTIISFEKGKEELLEQLDDSINVEMLRYPVLCSDNVRRLHQIVVDNDIDIFVNQWGLPFKTTMLCNKAIRGTKCKLVSVLHGSPNTSKVIIKAEDKVKQAGNAISRCVYKTLLYAKNDVIKRSIRYAVRHNERYVLLSNAFIEPLIEYAKIKDASNVTAIGNPITVPVDSQGFSLANKKKQLLYVGRMDYENKRVNRIVEAWEKLYGQYTDWELVLVGDGPHKKALTKYVADNGIERVRFEGFRKEPPISFYKDASIFLLTSDLEGFGLVIIESMSYGVVPIVYGSYEAVYDIIRDGVSGYITTKPYSREATIDRLRLLMDNREKREEMAKAAMADAAKFTIESISQQWYYMFDRVLNFK